MRVGMGYDVHKLVKDRKLIMGGVEIPYELGLLGHSDADVLLHAIMDALLGAAALGDIGKHFPDTDDRYKGISSIKLLEEVGKKIDEANYIIENNATVRQTAKQFRISKSTVHKDVTERLLQINPSLAHETRKVLDTNKSERHIRGGLATREKYLHLHASNY